MKAQRQAAMLQVIREARPRNQRELAEGLKARGFEVSQTTVSRDLAELGITRIRGSRGAVSYAEAPGAPQGSDGEALRRSAPQVLLTVEPTGNLVVVKTRPGSAQSLAWAIDAARLEGVAGTVGGDDTILVVCSEGTASGKVSSVLMEYALEQR